ncbi:MAG TPA: hypothetical protein DEA55_03760 [Rhodospirillaceae bacterium]|nr:hypothetical protein [Rhodospirillaceae bacterium]
MKRSQEGETLTQGEFFQSVRQNASRHGFGVYKEGPHVVLRRIDGDSVAGLRYVFKNASNLKPTTPLSQEVVNDLMVRFPECFQS